MRPFTLRDAHRPYLGELELCMCELCRAVEAARCSCALCMSYAGPCYRFDLPAYARALSDRLFALTEGAHVRVEWADYLASLPALTPLQKAQSEALEARRRASEFRIGRDDVVHGMGLGISPH